MDQLKEFLGLFRRQHFWFILPVLLITSLVGWFLASGKLSEAVSSQHSSIDGQIRKAQGISKIADHPNENCHLGQGALNAARLENVKNAWSKKWLRQEGILVWPEQGWSFCAKVKGMRHIESIDEKTAGLTNYDLFQYKNYVRQELPKLAARIDAKWDPLGRSNSNSTSDEGEGVLDEGERPDESYTVEWEKASQEQIDRIFDWGVGVPTTLEMLYAQEDLWVLSSLMDIIKKTNEGARTRATASVKKIVSIQFGQGVKPQKFRVIRPSPPQTGEEDLEDPLDNSFEPEPEIVPEEGDDDDDNASKKPHPALNRYVDDKFQPIEQVSMEVLGVAKRIPVRIRVVMDQRHVNRFLVASANSPLTFEIHQHRFNPKTGNFAQRSGERRHAEEPGGAILRVRTKVKKLGDVSTFDRIVEFYGIIYIFNPVNESLLGVESGENLEA